MFKTPLILGAPFVLALALILAPVQAARTTAQMGPTMAQPLDQLSGDAFDQAFLREMTMHHAMAVMMARPVVANGQHQELKDLAASIIADQTREIAQMRTWAKDWYGMEIPDMVAMMDQGQMPMMPGQGMPMQPGQGMPHGQGMPMQPSQGMPHGQGMPMMPGAQQQPAPHMRGMSMMADLWVLPPNRLEAVFMSLMIPHHEGAIEMAKLVPDRAAHQELKDLAKTIIESQTAEIARMNEWLAAWYGL